MLGTIVNTSAILIGAGTGSVLNKALPKGLEKTLVQSTGLVALCLGISWIAKHLPSTPEPLVFILSLAGGGVVGEMLQLEITHRITETAFYTQGRWYQPTGRAHHSCFSFLCWNPFRGGSLRKRAQGVTTPFSIPMRSLMASPHSYWPPLMVPPFYGRPPSSSAGREPSMPPPLLWLLLPPLFS